MRDFLMRLLRRTLPVVIALAVLGYLLGEMYLMLSQMNGGNNPDTSARWRAPLMMAGAGMVIMIVFETLFFVIRRRNPLPPTPPRKPELPE